MFSSYLIVKLVHIVSATLLFGTGLGTAFFMFNAHRSGDPNALQVTSRYVVIADYLFTLPAVVVQLGTGFWLTDTLGISRASVWFVAVLTLFVVVGLCWVPVVFIQIRIGKLAAAAGGQRARPQIDRLMRRWTALGIPAFVLTLLLFALMVLKPGIGLVVPWLQCHACV
jgi:uncharacterized membrane protein